MEKKHFKIAISGPVGSGKTTLAHALATRLDAPLFEENMKGIYDAHACWKQVRQDTQASDADRQSAIRRCMQAFKDWADERRRLYAAHEGFVADRWEADLLDAWLKMYADYGYDKTTASLFKDMREKAKLFDYAVVMPLQSPFAEEKNESGLVRKKAFSLRLMSHLLTGGLIRQCPQLPVIALPIQPMTVDERVQFIQDAIQKNAIRCTP